MWKGWSGAVLGFRLLCAVVQPLGAGRQHDAPRLQPVPCHAPLPNRAGGALGHGCLLNLCAPQRVEGRWVPAHEAVLAACASDSSSAAITSEGKLYTWGSNAAGQLGHGEGLAFVPVTQPKLVRALYDAGLRVSQVSCGPHHTAAITWDGALFTWGDGMFGRLGHGDAAACFAPRRVEALEHVWVTSVSCGWWHTAAVAAARSYGHWSGGGGGGGGGAGGVPGVTPRPSGAGGGAGAASAVLLQGRASLDVGDVAEDSDVASTVTAGALSMVLGAVEGAGNLVGLGGARRQGRSGGGGGGGGAASAREPLLSGSVDSSFAARGGAGKQGLAFGL